MEAALPRPAGPDLAADPGDVEPLLWAIMATFERQAIAQYERHLPGLVVPAKRAALERLLAASPGPGDDLVSASDLAGPIRALSEAAAAADGPLAVALVQGLVLEPVRRVIYDVLAESRRVSERSRSLSRAARAGSQASAAAAAGVVRELTGGEDAFAAFAAATEEVLSRLDAVGEGVDRAFGPTLDLRFADVVGGFVADLVPTCVELGMNRRKVMGHLAGALMGL